MILMKTKRHGLIKSLACLLVLILILTACGQQSQDTTPTGQSDNTSAPAPTNQEKVTIRYWTHENPAFVEIAKKFAADYMAANPNVTIEHEAFTDYSTKFYSAMAAGIEADIMEFYGSPIRFAKGGILLPVDESVITKEELEKSFYPNALQNRLYDGKYYGIPEEINVESPGLLVNTALLKEQGVEIPQSWKDNNGPATWSELMEMAHKLTKVENGKMTQAGLGVVGGEEVSMFLSLIWQQGGDYRDEANNTVNFETKEAKGAVDFIKNLVEGPDAVHSLQFSGRFDGFKEGTVAMTIGAPWATAVINQDMPDFEYEYYNLPAFIDGSKPYFVGEGGWGQIVSARSKAPQESWKFVKYMTSAEKQLEWVKSTGSVPSRMDVSNDEYFTSGDGSKVIARAMKVLDYGRDPGAYTLDPFTLVWDTCYNNLNTITAGQVTTEEGLANMQKAATEMIKNLKDADVFENAK
jgi:ABC-type glycerol-3-phosphate transport system substrate-binding protein